MISRTTPTECFVYITLPGETAPVTAGRFELIADRGGTPVGRFVYGRSYLDRRAAVEIDPVELKLARGTFETTAMKGVFGALRDSGPDHWGRTVIERRVGKAPLGELDYLLESPDDRAGALGFGSVQIRQLHAGNSTRRSNSRSSRGSRTNWSRTRKRSPPTPRPPRCRSCF